MEMPKPTEAHRKLEKLVGSWHGEETMHPSPWDPEGGVAQGQSEACLALDGFAVVVDYEQERDGVVSFTGHAVYTYDVAESCYVLHWFDCMGVPPNVFKGEFEGDVLTLTTRDSTRLSRIIADYSEDGLLRSAMEMSPDGENWSTLFEGEYRRSD